MNRWYAVRCCCTPTKVFGFLLLDADSPYVGMRLVLNKAKKSKLSDIMKTFDEIKAEKYEELYETIQLRTYGPPWELAVYSEDRPIEFWREIEGFVEAVV